MTDSNNSFLEQSASQYSNRIVSGWEKLYGKKREYLYKKIRQHTNGNLILEMGCADGEMTQRLVSDYLDVTVVDGSKTFLDALSKKITAKNIHFQLSLFEHYSPEKKFDLIIMAHILEHLDDPIAILKKSKDWLKPNGQIFVAVPNAQSIHRMIGVKLGMLPKIDSLNEQDKILGHKRVYTPELLKSHIFEAGFKIEKFGGCMLKPLSNRQIETQWSDELIEAFFALGDDYPELCSEIFAVLVKTE